MASDIMGKIGRERQQDHFNIEKKQLTDESKRIQKNYVTFDETTSLSLSLRANLVLTDVASSANVFAGIKIDYEKLTKHLSSDLKTTSAVQLLEVMSDSDKRKFRHDTFLNKYADVTKESERNLALQQVDTSIIDLQDVLIELEILLAEYKVQPMRQRKRGEI